MLSYLQEERTTGQLRKHPPTRFFIKRMYNHPYDFSHWPVKRVLNGEFFWVPILHISIEYGRRLKKACEDFIHGYMCKPRDISHSLLKIVVSMGDDFIREVDAIVPSLKEHFRLSFDCTIVVEKRLHIDAAG